MIQQQNYAKVIDREPNLGRLSYFSDKVIRRKTSYSRPSTQREFTLVVSDFSLG